MPGAEPSQTGCIRGDKPVSDLAALRDTQRRYREVFQGSRDGIVMVDTAAHIVDANRAYCEMLGYSLEQLRGLASFYNITPESWHAWEAEEIWRNRLLRRGYSGVYEKEYIRRDGAVFPVELQAYAVFAADGSCEYLWAVARDITGRRKAREALRQSERRFRQILETIDLIAVQSDLQGRVTFCNRYLARLTGWSREKMLGRKWLETFIPRKWRGALQRDFLDAVGDGSAIPAQRENPILARDGTERLVSWSNTLLRDESGRVVGLTAIGQDITEQRRAEDALRRSEATAKALLNATQETAMLLAPDGTVLACNDIGARRLQTTVGELVGTCLFDWIPPEVADRRRWMVFQAARSGRPVQFSDERAGMSFEVNLYPVLDARGCTESIAVFAREISERKRAEQALRRTQNRLQSAQEMVAVGHLAAYVAHEINNPLAGMKNALLLIRDAIPADHPRLAYVDRLDGEIDRIASIVRQMLHIGRPEREPDTGFAPADVIRDVIALLETDCRQRQVELEAVGTQPATPVQLPRGKVVQVLFNLLKNAIHASPPDGVVEVRSAVADGALRISVADRGGGVPEEIASRIFDPLFTTKPASGQSGLGLGLSITKTLVEEMGGSLGFDPRPGGGTEFYVVLPAGVPSKEADHEPDDEHPDR